MSRMDMRFDQIDSRFDSVDQRLENLEARVTTLEEKSHPQQAELPIQPTQEQTSSSGDEDMFPDHDRLPPSFDTIHGEEAETIPDEENPLRNSRKPLPKPKVTSISFQQEQAEEEAKKTVALSKKSDAARVSKDDDRLPKNADRRKTMQERNVYESLTKAQPVTFQAAQPDYQHIKLTALKVVPIVNFFEEIAEYQTAYNIKIHVPLRLSQPIRRKIMSKFAINSTKLMMLNDDELYNILRTFVTPDSKVEFSTLLEASVEFNIRSSYKPTAEYFRPFYDALLEFRIVFVKTYELLATDNADNIPECRNKEGGLICIFINKIPFMYGTRVLQELNKKKVEESVYAFLTEFYVIVEAHLLCHVKARHLSRFFGGTAYEASKRTDKSLSNIKAAPVFEEVYDDTEPEPEPESESEKEDSSHSDEEEDDGFDDDLAAMQSPAASRSFPGGTGPCFTKVNTGRCDKPNCAFSHSADAIQKARDERIAALRKLQQPAAPKVGVSLPRKN